MTMTRRGTATDPKQYIEVRLEQLRAERNKNNDADTHMIIDKAIYELTVVLELITRGNTVE